MTSSWLALLLALSACEFPRPADVLPADADGPKQDGGGPSATDASDSDAAPDGGPSLDLGHQRVACNGTAQQAGQLTEQMFTVRLDGTGERQLTSEPAVAGSDQPTGAELGTISPDGKYVVFAVGDANVGRDLVVQNSDGTGRRVLITRSSATDLPGRPAMSADGQRVAYFENAQGGNNIFVVSFAKGDAEPVVRITPAGHSYDHPSWRGNSQVAFDDRSDVMLVNADGTGLVNLTNNPARDTDPAFSHDGRKIAFISNRSGSNEAWIMNADGSAPQQVTTTGAISVTFDVTDRYLVYENGGGADGSDFGMMIIGVDGSGKMKVTPPPRGASPFTVYPDD